MYLLLKNRQKTDKLSHSKKCHQAHGLPNAWRDSQQMSPREAGRGGDGEHRTERQVVKGFAVRGDPGERREQRISEAALRCISAHCTMQP